MKKIALAAALLTLTAASYAYNPPLGGENLHSLTSPELISGGASATGGPIFTVVPASITYNPAITALEQRVTLDLSGTMLFNTENNLPGDSSVGGGFQLGLLVPTRYGVFTGTVQGLFCDMYSLNIGNSVVLHGGASKDITEKLSVGMNVYTGFYFGCGGGSDFTVGADLGVLYLPNDIGFLKEPKFGISLLNCGKPASSYKVLGIDKKEGNSYPGILTPRVSFGAVLFKTPSISGGFSADLSFPTCQNVVADFGFGVTMAKIITVATSWQANVRELLEQSSDAVSWPSVGVNCRLSFKSEKVGNKFADWKQSEITPSLAWQNLYSGIHAVSAGAKINLGMEDKDAPVIYLWDEEMTEDESTANNGE